MDDSQQLAAVTGTFAELFEQRYQTELVGGADEPFYRAADSEHGRHQLFFRGDYVASALHEIAHWCIAGERRRQLDDFGYWYQPGERSAQLQRQFEAVEVAPQALEWLFARSCGRRFQLSVDNFALDNRPPVPFAQAVCARLQGWLKSATLPPRAQEFATALAARRLPSTAAAVLFDPRQYSLAELLLAEAVA